MGGSTSKNTTSVITEAATDALARSIMECRTTGRQTQDVSQIGSGNVVRNVAMRQSYVLNMDCVQNAETVAKMQDEVVNAIKQKAESESVGILGALGSSRSEVDTQIRNSVKTSLTFENITRQIGSMTQSQSIFQYGTNNLIEGVSMEQLSTVIRNASQSIVQSMEIIKTLGNKADQSTVAKQQNPFQFLVDMFNSLITGGTLMTIVVVIAAVTVAFIFRKDIVAIITGKDPVSDNPAPEGQPPRNT